MRTEIIKIEALDDAAKESLRRAASVIKKSGLVVFPTETVYGLGADATSPMAAKKIYEAKGRPSDNPLIIHISKPEDAEAYAVTSESYYKLAKVFMPGPLTVVLTAKNTVPMETRASLPTVAVRCPENIIARTLIEYSGVPIAAPSANISGTPSPTKASHVIDDMQGRVDMIIDGGDCDIGLESTIVKIDTDGELTLLRPGKITVEDLRNVCERVTVADAVTGKLAEGAVAISPGMKYRHYAPSAPLYLLNAKIEKCIEYLEKIPQDKKIAVMAYESDIEYIKKNLPKVYVYKFGNRDDEGFQAYSLFDILRDADKRGFDEIYAPLPKTEGLGLALYNRMIRAAAHHIIDCDGM